MDNDVFIFGSEIKAITVHPSVKRDIDINSLSSFLRHNYVPAPNSIFKNLNKLEAGKFISYKVGSEPLIKTYWSLGDHPMASFTRNSRCSLSYSCTLVVASMVSNISKFPYFSCCYSLKETI